MQGYTIWVFSRQLNERQRWIDLHDMQLTSDQYRAQQLADAAAGIYNRDRRQNASDWVGQIEWQQVGVETLPNFLFQRF
jgi:hypothetical protein